MPWWFYNLFYNQVSLQSVFDNDNRLGHIRKEFAACLCTLLEVFRQDLFCFLKIAWDLQHHSHLKYLVTSLILWNTLFENFLCNKVSFFFCLIKNNWKTISYFKFYRILHKPNNFFTQKDRSFFLNHANTYYMLNSEAKAFVK